MTDITLDNIRRLRLHPDDKLVVSLTGPCSVAAEKGIRQQVQARLNIDNDILVLDGGMKLDVLTHSSNGELARTSNLNPTPLYAEIRKTSPLANQIARIKQLGVYPFPITIMKSEDGRHAIGGLDGRYALEDLIVYAAADNTLIRISE